MARAGTKVGTGYVAIEPDFSGFQEAVERAIKRRFAALGDQAGKDLGDGVSRRLRAQQRDGFGLGPVLDRIRSRMSKAGVDAGRDFSKGVARGAQQAGADMFGLSKSLGQLRQDAGSTGRAMASLERDMFGVGRAAKDAGRQIVGTRLGGFRREAVATERVTRALGTRLRGLVSDFRNVRVGARTAAGGFGGINGAMARANRTAQFFRNVMRLLRFPAIVTGVGLLTQGLSALAAGFTAAASAAGPLMGALVAMPALAATAAQAFGALKLATAGVGDTIKAALDAQVKGGSQAVDTMRQQQAAADRVADAQRNLSDAERQTKLTREALTSTIAEARREYEDLRLAVEGLPEVEEEAALRLKELRQELIRTASDSESSELDIRFAENAVEQAENDLKRVRMEARRTRQDYKAAVDGGVRQMPQVVEARRAVTDAVRAEKDAQRDLEQAIDDNTAAMANQGAAATKLQEEMSQLPPAAQAFVRQVVAMKPRLDQLRATAASGLFPGVTTGLKGLMGNFGVVNQLVGQTSGAFGRLAARAGTALGGQEWGRDLALVGGQNVKTINQLGDAGGNLADTFRHLLVAARPFINWLGKGTVELTDWIEAETKAGRETGRLAAFFDRTKKSMQLLGPILKGTAGSLLNIGKAARPVGNEILAALGKSAEGFRKWTASTDGQNGLRKYFADAKPAIFEMGRLLRDVTKAFFTLGNQPGAAPLIKQVRTELLPALTDVIGTLTGAFGKALVGTFTSVVKLVEQLSKVNGPLVTIVKGFGALAAGLAFAIDKVPGMDILVTGVLGFVAAIKAWTIAQGALNVVLAMNPIGLVVTALAGLGFALYMAWTKSETFRKVVTGAFNAVVNVGKFLADKYLGYITTILGGFSSLVSAGSKLPFVGGKFKGLAGVIDTARAEIDGFRETLRGGNRDAEKTKGLKAQQREVDALKTKLAGLKKGTREYKDTAEALRKKQRELNAAIADAKKPAGNARDGYGELRGSVNNLGSAMGNVAAYTQDGVNKLLGEFGADPLKHKVKPFKAAAASVRGAVNTIGSSRPGTPKKQQRGGPLELAKGSVVPGQGTGDTVPLHVGGRLAAMVEPGELVSVANRKATAALMRVNKAVPRFQGGGIVELLHPFNDPAGHGGGNSHLHIAMSSVKAIVALGRRLQRMGWLVGEHPAFGGVGGMHAPNGYHYSARAIDVNWPDPSQEAAKIRALLPSLGGAAGGLLGNMAEKIKRLKVSGGTDTTRGILQGAADRLRKGANAYLAKTLAPIEGAETVLHGDGDVESVFAKTAKRLSKSKIATLALGMAGYAESGMRDLDYGDADSLGALQLRQSVHPGVNPHDEGLIASLFLQRGFTGRGGANALAAQGLPAHLVAQGVQGSFDSTGSNYLAQEGRARAWMKRFGLKNGGLVRMVGDSLGVGTVKLGGLAGKLKQKLAANVLTGRPAQGSADLFTAGAKQYLFDLGTNDTAAGAPAQVLRAVDRLTGDAPIHALTLNGPLADAKNAALRAAAGGDISLIPWAANSRGLLAPDGYHATGVGYGKRATLIANAVNATAAKIKQATNAKKRQGSTKKGGIGSPLGEIDISQAARGSGSGYTFTQALRQSLKRVRRPQSIKGTRKGQMQRLMARINEEFSLPADLVQRLNAYEGQDAFLDDRASRADSLTVDVVDGDDEPVLDPEGRQVVELGRMDGRTAAQWTQQRLGGLIEWRNDLIEARVRVRELVAQVATQIAAMEAKAAELREKIAEQLKIKTKLTDFIAAKRRPKKLAGKIERLSNWLAPRLRDHLNDKKITPKLLRDETREKLNQRLDRLVAIRGANVRERNAITGKILPALTGRRDALTEDQTTYESGLDNVQGPGGGRERADKFYGQVPDYFGQFSGQIFDAHQRLKELNAPGPIIKKDPDEPDNSRNLDRELFNQQYGIKALEELQKNISAGMQRLVPFGGVFHQGGIVPGQVGQERVALVKSGEGYFTREQMAALQPVAATGPGDMKLYLIVEDGAVDDSKIKAIARDEAGREYQVQTKRERGVMRQGLAPA